MLTVFRLPNLNPLGPQVIARQIPKVFLPKPGQVSCPKNALQGRLTLSKSVIYGNIVTQSDGAAMKSFKIALAVSLVAWSGVVFPQDVSDMNFKQHFVGASAHQIPDSIAFKTAAEIILLESAQLGREAALATVQWRLKLGTNDASEFLDRLYVVVQLAKEEDKRTQGVRACDDGNPFEILYDLYAVTEQVYEQAYIDAKAALPPTAQPLLEEWVADQKTTMGYGKLDFQASYSDKGLGASDARLTLANLCEVN